jgi:hypothetical protein
MAGLGWEAPTLWPIWWEVYLQAAKQLTTLARASDSRAADFVKVETDTVFLAEEPSIHSCSDLQT